MGLISFFTLLLPLGACCVSVMYFFAAPKSASVMEVLLGSLHGVVLAALTVMAMPRMRSPLSVGSNMVYLFPLVPPVLAFLMQKVYRGPKSVHRFQFINLLCYLQLIAFSVLFRLSPH